MSDIRKFKDNNGNTVYPMTVADAVFDNNGVSVSDKLNQSVFYGNEISNTNFELEFDLVSRVEALEKGTGQSDDLLTESKNIIGAINELKIMIDENNIEMINLLNDITDSL